MALAVLCAAVSPARGEEKPVTLDEILAVAKEHNGDLKALRAELGIAEAVRTRASRHPNPTLELEGETGALTGSPSENSLSIGLTQEVLTGGKRAKRLSVADAEATAALKRFEDAERVVQLEVKTGFYRLLLAQDRLELAHRFHTLNGQLLQVTGELFAAGDVAELDVNLAKVESARSEGRITAAERERDAEQLNLLSLTGSPEARNIVVTPPAVAGLPGADLAALKAKALEARPDLRALERERAKADAEVLLARAERLPNVTAGISLSRESTVTSLGNLEEKERDYLLGLSLSIPLPLFDRNQAGVQEALARKSGAENRQLFARQRIEREVESAVGQLASAEKSVAIFKKEIIPQLEANLAVVQEAYRLGETGILAVIEEQKKYIEVSESYLSALHDLYIATARLEAAVGTEMTKEAGGIR